MAQSSFYQPVYQGGSSERRKEDVVHNNNGTKPPKTGPDPSNPDQPFSPADSRKDPLVADIILLIFIFVIGYITGILTHFAEAAIKRVRNWEKDPFLSRAVSLLEWGIRIHWIAGIALFVFSIIFVWFLGKIKNYLILIIEIVVALTYFTTAIIALVVMVEITKSPSYKTGNRNSRQAVTLSAMAGVLAIIVAIAIVIWAFILTSQYERGEESFGTPLEIEVAEKVESTSL